MLSLTRTIMETPSDPGPPIRCNFPEVDLRRSVTVNPEGHSSIFKIQQEKTESKKGKNKDFIKDAASDYT